MSYFSQPANPTNVDQMEDIADNAAYLVDESGDLGNPWTKSKTAVNFTIEEDEGYEADDCPENVSTGFFLLFVLSVELKPSRSLSIAGE